MKVLLIIDMINGFCRKGFNLSLAQDTKEIEKYIKKRIKHYHQKGFQIIFCCDSHTKNAVEFKQYPTHCLKGSFEAEIVDSLNQFSTKDNTIFKNTLSVFYKTKLAKLLKNFKPELIEVVGVCTDICDLFAVYELRNRGYKVFVSYKGVLPLDINKQIETLTYLEKKLGADIEYPK